MAIFISLLALNNICSLFTVINFQCMNFPTGQLRDKECKNLSLEKSVSSNAKELQTYFME
jgi:hypothetical protein